ncbi:MAG TPA: sugar phosphate nucleotidyltransferase [Thermoanaerobaculia bacterium]|nr:sugar phosphate nucleotidyltransferase [Thermoanaerobaculia bacterium]
MVLAAGHGTRLQPLTERTPKPLLPLLGRPILAHTLDRLVAAGCEAAAINLHHLGEQIPTALGGSYRGMPLTYSREETLLGTAGALLPLRGFFADCREVLVVNGDTLCRWPLARLLRRHRRLRPAATLLVTTRAEPRNYGGGLGIDRRRRLLRFGAGEEDPRVTRRRVFAGAHVVASELLARLPAGASDFVRDLYRPLLEAGETLTTVTTRRAWHDLGTPQRYLEGALEWARWTHPLAGYRGRGSRVAAGARLRRVAVEGEVVVAPGCRLERCLLLPGARIGAGCRLRRVVVGPGAEVPPGTQVEARLLTRAWAGGSQPAGSSHLGELVVSPLEPTRAL